MDDFGTILLTRGWPPAKRSGLRGRFSTASLPCHCGLEGLSPYHEERRKATIFQKVATALANPSSAGQSPQKSVKSAGLLHHHHLGLPSPPGTEPSPTLSFRIWTWGRKAGDSGWKKRRAIAARRLGSQQRAHPRGCLPSRLHFFAAEHSDGVARRAQVMA